MSASIVLLALLCLSCRCLGGKFSGIYDSDGNRIYTIALGHDYAGYEYVDDKGYITGFSYDLVSLVCNEVQIRCRTIWDRYDNMWDSQAGVHAYGGKGLLARWYDGALGWSPTIDRIHVFDFSMSHESGPGTASFYVALNSAFTDSNISGKKIGFVDGWGSDEKCVARQSGIVGNVLQKDQIVYAANPTKLLELITDGKVAAGFVSDETASQWVKDNKVKQLTKRIKCFLDGDAMMSQKDNDFIAKWNIGISMLRSNGRFAKFCEQAKITHGTEGAINC